jgi:hypothetical protein
VFGLSTARRPSELRVFESGGANQITARYQGWYDVVRACGDVEVRDYFFLRTGTCLLVN